MSADGGRLAVPVSERPETAAEQVLDLADAAAAAHTEFSPSAEQQFLSVVEDRLVGAGATPRWESRHRGLLFGTDALAVVLAVLPLGLSLLSGASAVWPVAAIPVLWLALNSLSRSYEPSQQARVDVQLRRTFDTGVRAIAIVLAVTFATGWNPPHAAALSTLALLLLLPVLGRVVVRQLLHSLRRRGHWMHRVLAVGPVEAVRTLANEAAARPEVGLSVVAACTPEDLERLDVHTDELPVLGPPELAGTAARVARAHTVAVLPDALPRQAVRRLAWELEGTNVQLLVAPAVTDVAGPRISVRPMNAFALLHLEQPTFDGVRRVVKHSLDRVAALALLLLLSPVLLVITVLIRRDSPGGALFRQQRVGKCGVPFSCFKFRTMCEGAEQQVIDLTDKNETGGTLFKIRKDPRVTKIGATLRRYSLDELPQLLNVVRGEMSLVGPRPPLQSEVDTYGDDVRRRLLVRPGMTGLWQVSGRSDLSWEETVRLDLYYVENWSPLLDLTILWRTVNAVRSARGAY